MREPVTDNKVGDLFSKAFNNLRCAGDLSRKPEYQNYQSDIMSIWECMETGKKFAFFCVSGIREITGHLYDSQLVVFFRDCDIV